MKLIVTGGAGLIGSSLVRRLLDQGHRVLVLDDFKFSYSSDLSPRIHQDISVRFDYLLKGAKIERCSTLEKLRMRQLFSAFDPDCVVHLAAIPLVSVATRHAEAAAESLSRGLVNVLEVVRDAPGTGRFVYVSSSMVYGNFEMDPMPENGPKDPINIYGGLKLAGEILTKSYLKSTTTEYVIVRPSSVYGPTDQHRRVAQKFCENAILGKPILLSDSNDHTMDFTYVDDIAQGLFLACTHGSAAGETFNMSYGSGRRLTELLEVVRQIEPSVRLSSEGIDDSDRPTRGSLSIEKAQRLLGFQPQWPLERGIPIYLDHLRGVHGRLAGAV